MGRIALHACITCKVDASNGARLPFRVALHFEGTPFAGRCIHATARADRVYAVANARAQHGVAARISTVNYDFKE